MLAGAKLIQEKHNAASNNLLMLERSNSQLQIGDGLKQHSLLDTDETYKYPKNLPVISESTEKLCTLKLK